MGGIRDGTVGPNLFPGKPQVAIGFNCFSKEVGTVYEPWHEISNNVVCATIKGSDQPLLVSEIFFDCYAPDRTSFGVYKL